MQQIVKQKQKQSHRLILLDSCVSVEDKKCHGRILTAIPGKVVITRGFHIETPPLVEIVPNYTKCNNCKLYLGKKEEDLADVLDYNCVECFEMQIEAYSVKEFIKNWSVIA